MKKLFLLMVVGMIACTFFWHHLQNRIAEENVRYWKGCPRGFGIFGTGNDIEIVRVTGITFRAIDPAARRILLENMGRAGFKVIRENSDGSVVLTWQQ